MDVLHLELRGEFGLQVAFQHEAEDVFEDSQLTWSSLLVLQDENQLFFDVEQLEKFDESGLTGARLIQLETYVS